MIWRDVRCEVNWGEWSLCELWWYHAICCLCGMGLCPMRWANGICCEFGFMTTSSNGNVFRVTGPLWGEFTGHRWIPLAKASDAGLWCFRWSAPEKTAEQITESPLRMTLLSCNWTECMWDEVSWVDIKWDGMRRNKIWKYEGYHGSLGIKFSFSCTDKRRGCFSLSNWLTVCILWCIGDAR